MLLFPLILLFGLWATPTFAQWANEPSGATRVLNCPMSAADCVGGVVRGTWLDIYHNLTYFTPGDAPPPPPPPPGATSLFTFDIEEDLL